MSRSYWAVAARVAAEKQASPQNFCTHPRCLWRTVTTKGPNPCKRHPHPPTLEQKLEKSVELSSDERWKSVTINTPVLFDGEMTTWGTLAGNEKMMCSWNAAGQLEGSMPF